MASGRSLAVAGTVALALVLDIASSSAAHARVLVHQDEALRSAFPLPIRIERETLFVDDEAARRIEKEAGVEVGSKVVTYYVGHGDDGIVGFAYFDRHLVRTLPETIMVIVDPQGRVRRIEILAFDEPPDYLAKSAWLEQFYGRRLGDEVALRKGIRNLTGASLTAEAITAACRRILVIHRIVTGSEP